MDVRCRLKIDNNLRWTSQWRSPSCNCWDSDCSLDVSQARELWIQVYWRRVYPQNTTLNSTATGDGMCGPLSGGGGNGTGSMVSSSSNTATSGSGKFNSDDSEAVLAAVQCVLCLTITKTPSFCSALSQIRRYPLPTHRGRLGIDVPAFVCVTRTDTMRPANLTPSSR